MSEYLDLLVRERALHSVSVVSQAIILRVLFIISRRGIVLAWIGALRYEVPGLEFEQVFLINEVVSAGSNKSKARYSLPMRLVGPGIPL